MKSRDLTLKEKLFYDGLIDENGLETVLVEKSIPPLKVNPATGLKYSNRFEDLEIPLENFYDNLGTKKYTAPINFIISRYPERVQLRVYLAYQNQLNDKDNNDFYDCLETIFHYLKNGGNIIALGDPYTLDSEIERYNFKKFLSHYSKKKVISE
jgi:hypothetical protein